MTAGRTIVSYENLTQPFGDIQKQLARTRDAAGQVIPDGAMADSRVAAIRSGLDELHQAQGTHPRVMHCPRNVTVSLLQSHIARNAAAENKLQSFIQKGLANILEAFEVRFSSQDWFRWMLSFFTWIEDIVPADFPSAPKDPVAIPNRYNVAVIGDWGTGLYGAPVCGQSIQADPVGYDLLLHLGDVYYAGLADEIDDRFLKFWPKVPHSISRSLNGNHEMYTGGHGYFEKILPAFGQTSSYFAFQNDYWVLAALDSAYNQPFGGQEGDLNRQQVDWLRGIIAAAGPRKIVLFTHHQPFSLLDTSQGPLLVKALEELLDARKIFAWYWGHEHRCVLYDQHEKFAFRGRCVGHGGFPEARPDIGNAPYVDGDSWRRLEKSDHSPGALVLDTPNLYIPGFEEQFSPHGFMRLEFRDQRLIEYVRAPDGANIYLRDLA